MRIRHLLVATVSLLVLAGCKDKQSPADTAEHLKAAQDLYAQKDYAKALVEIQKATRGDPKSGDAHYLAAEIHEGLGDPQSAFQEYARASMPDMNNVKAQLKVVEILIGAKQLDTALGRINGTLGARPDDADALALRAEIEQRQGNREKAYADAQAALSHKPGQIAAVAVLTADALQDKNTDKAMAALAGGLKAHPDEPSLLRLKAAILVQQGQRDDAIAIFRGLVAAEPQVGTNRTALAELEASTGHVDDGEKVLRDGVAAAPNNRELRAALIGFVAKYRDEAHVEAEIKAAIAAQPQDTVFDLVSAERSLRAGKPDQAAAALQAAITRVPEGQARASARIALARLDVSQGNDTDASKVLDDVIAAKADSDDALLLRAELLLKHSDAARAIPDLLAVASRQPRNATPFALLAQAYQDQGDTEKFLDALKKVVYFQPNNLAPATRLADAYLKSDKPDLAKQVIADFVAKNPDNLDARLALVRFAVRQKDWAGAQAVIDQMRRNPKFDRAVVLMNAELTDAKGQPAAAMSAFARQIEANPTKGFDQDALAGYTRSAIDANQTDPAITYVSGLVTKATKPDDTAAANLALASLYRKAGDDAKVSDALHAAVQAAPTQPAPYLQLAATLRAQQPDQAVAILNQGITAGASKEPLLMARATLEEAAGHKAAAIATYRDVLGINPQSFLAANNYASLAADAKPVDKQMLVDARRPLERFSNSSTPAVLDTLAWLDYRLGDFKTAKELLVRAKADTSPNPQLRFHYGAVLMALGEKDAGRSAVQSALQQQFPGKDEAQQLLTE